MTQRAQIPIRKENVIFICNYSAFMAITSIDSKDKLSDLVKELGVHSKGEKVEVLDYEDVYVNEGDKNL